MAKKQTLRQQLTEAQASIEQHERNLLDTSNQLDVEQQNAIFRSRAKGIVLERRTRQMRAKFQHIIFGLACRLDEHAREAMRLGQRTEAIQVEAETQVEFKRLQEEHRSPSGPLRLSMVPHDADAPKGDGHAD